MSKRAPEGVLFIGGPADGQWKCIPTDQHSLKVMSEPAWDLIEERLKLEMTMPLPTERSFQEHEYLRLTFGDKGETESFFVVKGLTGLDALRLLMKHYRPK